MSATAIRPRAVQRLIQRPEFVYSAALFLLAVAVVASLVHRSGGILQHHSAAVAVLFALFGLFTISAGYEHPRIGYVSFDRVCQIASILILGPLDAAWVNGLASLIFPLKRLREGVSRGRVLTASLNNAGLMTLMILMAGALYVRLGGAVPLMRLEWSSILLLPILILSMQALNEAGMAMHLYLRDGRSHPQVNRFVFALESGAGLAAVVLAIVFNRLEPAVTALLLTVMGIGMLVLRQFAQMRTRLETLVEERTRTLREKTIELEQLATRDQLTGLYNRRFAETYLEGRVEEYYRYRRGFAIAMIDLDHFKRINDERSHEVGDRVLRLVARILAQRCRKTDLVARYGGEEFLLCFPDADADTVAGICEQLRHSVASADWPELAPDLSVSLSAGIAEMRPGLDRGGLLRAADHKLYAAKNGGRNLVLR